ncbi:MAG: TfoX/Sxy family protein [Dehalococcoidia bacterium]
MPQRPAAKQPSKKPAAKQPTAKQPATSPGSEVFAKAKPDPALLERVEALMGEYPVYRRPMFGVVAWFVEANAAMLGCVWRDALNLRVGAEDARALIESGKATPFDPMGRGGMREYVLVPASTLRPAQLRQWVERALAFTETVPAKKGR